MRFSRSGKHALLSAKSDNCEGPSADALSETLSRREGAADSQPEVRLTRNFVWIDQQVPGNPESYDLGFGDGLGIDSFSVRVYGGHYVAAREATHEDQITRFRAALLRCFHSLTVTATFSDINYRR